MREHFVLDINNVIIQPEQLGKLVARPAFVQLQNAGVVIIDIQLAGAGQHTVTDHAADFTGIEHERIAVVAFRYGRSGRQPGHQQTLAHIRRAANHLDQTVAVPHNTFDSLAVINPANA